MGLLMLRELLRRGVEVDLYVGSHEGAPLPVEPMPGLRLIVRRSPWKWGRWYSRNPTTALFTSLAVRSLASIGLSLRLLAEHRRNPYDAVYQLSQTELFLLGRVGRLAPPIVVHPCTHTAGELRWHRAEQAYALKSERRTTHFAIRAWLKFRASLQRGELGRADLVLGLSKRFNELVRDDYGVPEEKLRVLRTPVDLDRFTTDESSGRATPATLLFISRISTRKGVEAIIELSHRLSDLSGSVRLLLIGGRTMWSDYTAHLADLNPQVAEYIGSVSTSELPDLLRSATMLLVPSRYEPGSIVTAEALACGLPVVVTEEVGNAEVVSGPHARHYRADDNDEFERAVRSLLAAVERDGGELSRTARANAEEHFEVRTVVSELVEIISSLTDNGSWDRARPVAAPSGVLAGGDDALVRR